MKGFTKTFLIVNVPGSDFMSKSAAGVIDAGVIATAPRRIRDVKFKSGTSGGVVFGPPSAKGFGLSVRVF